MAFKYFFDESFVYISPSPTLKTAFILPPFPKFGNQTSPKNPLPKGKGGLPVVFPSLPKQRKNSTESRVQLLPFVEHKKIPSARLPKGAFYTVFAVVEGCRLPFELLSSTCSLRNRLPHRQDACLPSTPQRKHKGMPLARQQGKHATNLS